MTLAEIRAAVPDLFYAQSWFDGHAFMDRPEGEPLERVTVWAERIDAHPEPIHAVDLARLYVKTPSEPMWREFLWTDDTDDHGNRIYVGGIGKYGVEGFQVHRHLADPGAKWVRR